MCTVHMYSHVLRNLHTTEYEIQQINSCCFSY